MCSRIWAVSTHALSYTWALLTSGSQGPKRTSRNCAGDFVAVFSINTVNKQYTYRGCSHFIQKDSPPPPSTFNVVNSHPTTRIPNSSVLSVTKTACAMDLGNWEWYHRSAGVKTTGKILSMKQARKPRSYAIPKLCPLTYSLTHRGKV